MRSFVRFAAGLYGFIIGYRKNTAKNKTGEEFPCQSDKDQRIER